MADENMWRYGSRNRLDEAERARWDAWRDEADHGRPGRERGMHDREFGETPMRYRTFHPYGGYGGLYARGELRDDHPGGRDGWQYGRDYGAPPYLGYGRDGRWVRRDGGPHDRGWWDRASDEVSSWFGDDGAQRRREMDSMEVDRRGRGPKGYTRSDERIREDVCDALSDDTFVDASEIEVSVAGGEVTLSGTVDTRRARRRAEDCAERVSGVTHVQNNLRVDRNEASGTGRTGIAPPSAPFI